MAMLAPSAARLNDPRIQEVVAAVERYDIVSDPAWSELATLSNRTYLDGIEVDPAGVIIEDDSFTGVTSIYVLLTYGGDDPFETSDAFLGEFHGRFDGDTPVIETLRVDTSPFYAGAEAASAAV